MAAVDVSSVITQVQQRPQSKRPQKVKSRFSMCYKCTNKSDVEPEFQADEIPQQLEIQPQAGIPRRRSNSNIICDVSDPVSVIEAKKPQEKPVEPLERKKLLILDLDETLVHSTFTAGEMEGADIQLDLTVAEPVAMNYKIGVYKRPYLEEFLSKMVELFDVYVFTASMQVYCDAVMDIIDPLARCARRLYRNHCTMLGQAYVKDISQFGYDLKDVVIMDNSALSFQMHPCNGLLCPEFFMDKTDCYLKSIIPFMIELSKCEDVRDLIHQLGE